ncbi:MAG: PAS-domain containing protein [SAR324 cluster bacterium]|nr:PAS-domain containing protein [SAR324 cluster bacterium]
MKFFRSHFFILCLILTNAGFAIGQTLPLTENKKVVIAVDRDFPPLSLINVEGFPAGIVVDIWKLWSKKSGRSLEFQARARSNTLRALQSGEADIHSGLFRNEEREKWLDFSQAFYEIKTGLFYLVSHEAPLGLGSLSGQLVGVVKESHQASWLAQNHPEIKRLLLEDEEQLIQKARKGEIKAFLGEEPRVELFLNQLGLRGEFEKSKETLFRDEVFFAVRKGEDKLLTLFNEGFKKISREELQKIEARWIADPSRRFYQTPQPVSSSSEKGISLGEDALIEFSFVWHAAAALGAIILFGLLWLFQIQKQKRALQVREETINKIFENTPEPLFINLLSDDKLHKVNRAALEFHQMTETDLLNTKPIDAYVNPEDWLRIVEMLKTTETVTNFECKIKKLGTGEHCWCQISVVQDTYFGESVRIVSIHDITGRKLAEEEMKRTSNLIREKEAQLSTVINNMSGGIILIDKELNIQVFNEQAFSYINFPLNLIQKGSPLVTLIRSRAERGDYGHGDPEELVAERIQKYRESIENGKVVQYEDQVLGNNTLEVTLSPTDDGGAVLVVNDVTERKRAEKELAEKETQLRVVLDHMPGGIRYIDKDKNYVFFNSKYLELYDFPEGLLKIGESNRCENLYQAERGDFGPGAPEQLTDSWLGALPVDTELTSWERSTVHGKTLQVNTAPIPGGGVANIVTDITERKLLELELKEREETINMIFESIPQQLSVIRISDGKSLRNNDATAEFHQLSKEELLKKDVKSIYVNLEDYYCLLEKLRKRETISNLELEVKKIGTGEICWIATSISVVKYFGEAVFISASSDITKKKQAEKELKLAVEAAQIANHAKSEFLANMSHEIRTPMNSILGFTELLSEQIQDPKQKNFLSSIQSSGKSLLRLINDILDLSKIEAGKLELEYKAVNPHRIFEEMQIIFSQKVAEKGLDFLIEIDPDFPHSLLLDEIRLRQVLLNLIGNAIKFTESGFIKLTLQGSHPEGVPNKLDLTFSVQDTGIGIPVEQQELIFTAFEQQEGQNINKYGGTGLGLAISKRLIEMMKGQLSVSSEAGPGNPPLQLDDFKGSEKTGTPLAPHTGGSTFSVILKNVEVLTNDEPIEQEEELLFNFNAVRFEPATILIADDIEFNRNLVKGYLGPYDIDFYEASNGKVAIDVARRVHPDLVLMDVKMPVMGGYEATELLKNDSSTRDIPVVALTASAMLQSEKAARELCDGYLRKPISRTDLVKELMNFLKHSIEDSSIESVQVEQDEAFSAASFQIENPEPAVAAKLPELLEFLEGKQEVLETLQQAMAIDDIIAFAIQIQDAGTDYQVPMLVAWGERLESQASFFELDQLPETMSEYLKIKDAILLHISSN